jgi:hypothetical protein
MLQVIFYSFCQLIQEWDFILACEARKHDAILCWWHAA